MRKRYGRDVDATNIDLSRSDPWAFDYWGRDLTAHGFPTDPEDRKIQKEFWLRYIGNSRARLAEAFRGFFFPVAAYSDDPANAVKTRSTWKTLKRLYEELPEPADLTDRDESSRPASSAPEGRIQERSRSDERHLGLARTRKGSHERKADAPSCCNETKMEGSNGGLGVVSRACKAVALTAGSFSPGRVRRLSGKGQLR